MSDKFWNSEIEFKVMPSTAFPGRTRTELHLNLLRLDDDVPCAGAAPLYFDNLDPTEADAFVGGVFRDAFPRLQKFGYSPVGVNKLRATSIPDGRTRRIAEFLWKHGVKRFIEMGDDRARKKGRSSKDDFDEDGKDKRAHKDKK